MGDTYMESKNIAYRIISDIEREVYNYGKMYSTN